MVVGMKSFHIEVRLPEGDCQVPCLRFNLHHQQPSKRPATSTVHLQSQTTVCLRPNQPHHVISLITLLGSHYGKLSS